ncbi:hypothetical protein [Peribacillus simplex]|uniref:hypothetical protein n=1 Tax=Peribacillus simplex TaxID=1478 RepID=UPI0036D9C712
MLQNILYQVNLFGEFVDIEPKPENIMELMPLLSKFSLMPTTMQELNPNYGLVPLNRLSLASDNNEFRVDIGLDKVTISKNAVNNSGIIEADISSFVTDAEYILDEILTKYNKLGTRVSLISNGLFPETSVENLEETYGKFISPIDYYETNKPFEWNARSVSREKYNISQREETINIISEVARVQGHFNNQHSEFDRINLKTDINTIGQSTEKRLNGTSVKEFLRLAIESRSKLITQVESMVSE